MSDLGMYVGGDDEPARAWVYDDGIVVWVASVEEHLEQIRAEFGCGCLAVRRYDGIADGVIVVDGEPDSLMDCTAELLSAFLPDGLPSTDCRSTSMQRELIQAMGFEYPWFRADCLIPRPSVKEQVIHIDGAVVAEARRLLRTIH